VCETEFCVWEWKKEWAAMEESLANLLLARMNPNQLEGYARDE